MTQIHNSRTGRKLQLRQQLTEGMGPLRVLELYAGPGAMRASAWSKADEVIGIDSDLASVAEFHGETARTVRHLNLSRFNVFDADAFGMPWEPVWIIGQRCAELPDEIAVFITQGGGVFSLAQTPKSKGWSVQMCEAFGIEADAPLAGIMGKKASAAMARHLLGAFFPARTVTRFATATGGAGGGTLYAGAVLVRSGA